MTSKTFLSEALASVVVFLVALPLCMGIAIASGVPPAMGLMSGIIGGLVVGYFAGSPLQVSGPAAGLAVIVFDIVNTYGLAALGPLVIVAGLVQIAAGKLKLGQWFRAVAPAVIYGMLAGIGILIFASQFHVMVDDVPQSNGFLNVITIPGAVAKGLSISSTTPHHLAAAVGVLTLSVLVGWNWVRSKTTGFLHAVPAPLLAVGAGVAAAAAFKLPIAYVSVPASLGEMFMFPTWESAALLLSPAGLGTALALALIASAEALLCAVAVDKLHDDDRSDLDQELFAQGLGNTLAGLIGALPITGVIVRSTANVESGGTTRWSAVMHGGWLLIAVAAVPFLLETIPVASLAAVLVYIGFKLVNPEIPKALLARGKDELAIYLVTVGAIVATNLLEGLLIGFALSVVKLAWGFSHLQVDIDEEENHVDYLAANRSGAGGDLPRVDVHLRGSGTFVVLPKLARELEKIPAGRDVHVHLEHVDYVDHACFELLFDWRKQYETRNGFVTLEWEDLADRGTYRPTKRAGSGGTETAA
ncbi:MAG: SulP family inorganic anion transporter [Deltaproteobacteria bacterium]|nr:SulP family inorganic anion transporter [Deltaproteobacteria bacterium]